MNVLVIDVGTSSMRGILYDVHAAELKKIQISYSPFYIDQICVEQNASDWTSALIRICSGLAQAAKEENRKIDVLSLTAILRASSVEGYGTAVSGNHVAGQTHNVSLP